MNFIFCKFGSKYSTDFVNKIVMDLKLVVDFANFICYTDYDDKEFIPDIKVVSNLGQPTLKRVWPKLRLLSEDFPVSGKCIYLDLDTMVMSNPFEALESDHDWSTLHTIPAPWKHNDRFGRINSYDVTHHSSAMVWEAGSPNVTKIWDHFNSGYRDYFMRKYVGIDRFLAHENLPLKPLPLNFARSKKHQEDEHNEAIVTFEEIDVRFSDLV